MNEPISSHAPMYTRTPTTKAFENHDFLMSHPARNIRILCELEYAAATLQAHKVKATILFFGSARAKSRNEYDTIKEQLLNDIASCKQEDNERYQKLQNELKVLQSQEWMCAPYESVKELSRRLTAWAMHSENKLNKHASIVGVTREHPSSIDVLDNNDEKEPQQHQNQHQHQHQQRLFVCTGGGPGFMQAANEGATLVPEARNIGMGISLPFECGINKFINPELGFEFHYFFTRKFWMVYHCEVLVVAPGGFGTLDELFEVLTLKQTGKVQPDLPVILFGERYWRTIVNWEALVEFGTISQKDMDGIFFTDSPEKAAEHIIWTLTKKVQ